MHMKCSLSIFIPTYNRPRNLSALLEELGRQISQLPNAEDGIEIVVSDNSTNDNCAEVILDYRKKAGNARLVYHKNKYNIGADRNILQCYEKTCGNYVWILGDDDLLHESAVERVYNLTQDAKVGILRLEETIEDASGIPISHSNSFFSKGDFEISKSVASGCFGPELLRASCLVLKRPESGNIGPMSASLGKGRYISPLTLALDAIIEFGPGKGIAGKFIRYVEGDKSDWSDMWPWINCVNVPIALQHFASHMGAGKREIRRIMKPLTSQRSEAALIMILVKACRPRIAHDWSFILCHYLSNPLFFIRLVKRYLVVLAKKATMR